MGKVSVKIRIDNNNNKRHRFDDPMTPYERRCLRKAERKYAEWFRIASAETEPENMQDMLNGMETRLERIELRKRSTTRSSAEWFVLYDLIWYMQECLERLEPLLRD